MESLLDVRKKFPLIFRLTISFFLPLLVISMAGYLYLRASLPAISGQINVYGLLDKVSIERDKYAIPHIHAKYDLDAYYALGYVHAQDRLWQMEVNRRIASGRLSEVFGKTTIETDKFMRTLGLYRNAEKIWKNLNDENKAILNAYVEGVNNAIENIGTLPVEFKVYQYNPEKWRPQDSLVWMQLISWDLSSNFSAEIQRSLSLYYFGAKKTQNLLPSDDISSLISPIKNLEPYLSMMGLNYYTPKNYIGSNSWVISGKYTEDGLPILANDPHLANHIPSIWYLAELKGKLLNVVGATFPGLPFVVVGRNTSIAWGMTSMKADTQDVFLERTNPTNKNQYEYAGKFEDMETYVERIYVKQDFLRRKQAPIEITVRRTRHGPILSDSGSLLKDFAYSVRWTGDDENGGTFNSFVKLNYAQNWTEFNQALKSYIAPIHNFVYADVKGNIGYLAPGLFPIRKKGYGSLPVHGWEETNNWQGWISFENVPQEFNPERGYIVTANNKVVPDTYGFYLGSDWAPKYRADRIETELKRLTSNGEKKITVEDMKKLQGDTQSAPRELLKALLDIRSRSGSTANGKSNKAIALLAAWDGNMELSSVAGTIYTSWLAHINKLALEDDINSGEPGPVARWSLSQLVDNPNLPFIQQLAEDNVNPWCDYRNTKTIESCSELISVALDHAINELSLKLGDNPEKWLWSRIHTTQFSHYPFSKSRLSPYYPPSNDSVLSYLFHREIESPGGMETVNVAPITLSRDVEYKQFYGPAYRQIIDLSSNNKSYFIQATGQSGNVLSPHYDDFIKMHRDLFYIPMSSTEILSKLTLDAKIDKVDVKWK